MKIYLYIIGIIIAFLPQELKAQQSAQFSNYVFNYYAENPAFAATQKCLDFKLGGRFQWIGFDRAPRTYFASVIVPLSNPQAYHKLKHFVGAYVAQDRVGLFSQTYLKLSYTMQLRLFRSVYGAFGLFGGIKQMTIDNALADPAIKSGSALHYPDLMPGIMLYNKKFYLGLSVDQVYPKPIKNFADSKYQNEYFVSFGKRRSISSKADFFYSINVKFTYLTPPDVDLDAFWVFKKLTLGLGYRVGESAMAFIKLRLSKSIVMSYAFDFPLNKMRSFYTTSHELMFDISKCGGDDSPGFAPCAAYGN